MRTLIAYDNEEKEIATIKASPCCIIITITISITIIITIIITYSITSNITITTTIHKTIAITAVLPARHACTPQSGGGQGGRHCFIIIIAIVIS
jgi:hypothetical protein